MKRSLTVGLAWSVASFVLINWLDFFRRPACFDCGFPRGVPFTLYHDATFNSLNGFGYIVWLGAIADIAFAVVSGILLGCLIHKASLKTSTQI
jgi:hypothetical protein